MSRGGLLLTACGAVDSLRVHEDPDKIPVLEGFKRLHLEVIDHWNGDPVFDTSGITPSATRRM